MALGEGALSEADSLSLVLAQSDVVYLYLSFGEAQLRFVRQAANRKATLLAELQLGAGWRIVSYTFSANAHVVGRSAAPPTLCAQVRALLRK